MNIHPYKGAQRLKDWALLIEEQKHSGLSITDWCNKNNVNRQQFSRWQKKLSNSLVPTVTQEQPVAKCHMLSPTLQEHEHPTVFAEVPVSTRQNAKCQDRRPAICVQCPKCNIVIESGMDEFTIKAVLHALEVTC